MNKIKLELDHSQLQTLVDSLAQQPYNQVAGIIDSIKAQYENQTSPNVAPYPGMEQLVE